MLVVGGWWLVIGGWWLVSGATLMSVSDEWEGSATMSS